MEVAIGGAANISAEVAKGIFQEMKRHVRYVFIYKKSVDKFEEKLKALIAKREAVQQVVDEAERDGRKRTADVELWLDRVDKAVHGDATSKVKDLEDKAKSKCFIGLCPNLKSRYHLSKKAEEDAMKFDELVRQGVFSTVSYLDVAQDITAVANPKDFVAFESRKKVLDGIIKALKSSSISMMGVHGMSGVGKTTLVKQVARQVKEESLFDSVVVAVVNPSPDIAKLQDQIAEPLGLYLTEKSVAGRANRLRERLKREKKILIIFDDIWDTLNLNRMGIPFGDDDDQHKGCKIVLTSRDHNVLTTKMDAQETFALGVLEDKEAWDLFKKIAGPGGKLESSGLWSIVIEVVDKCGGLPIAITTVAKGLRNKGLSAWKDALRMLQRPSPTNFTGIPGFVYSAIELSYNHLESEEHRQIFLLCSVSGRYIYPSNLLRFYVGLRIFNHEVIKTLEEARDRLLTVVSDLIAASLLNKDDDGGDSLIMHDLVRDVALAIASRDNPVFSLKIGDILDYHWPDEETMRKYKRLAFTCPTILSELPEKWNCPELAFCFLVLKDSYTKLPPNSFRRMRNLQVLHLTNTRLYVLPPSISLLTKLRTLCLHHSILGDISIVGELKDLEILSLRSSMIEELPEEMGKLEKLKLLDLSDCTDLNVIPAGIISRLSNLEELYMRNSFLGWEIEGKGRYGNQKRNASLAELKALSCLAILELHIPVAEIVPNDFLLPENLRQYTILIGESWRWDEKNYEYSTTLKLELSSTKIDKLDGWAKPLLKRTEALTVAYVQDVEILLASRGNMEACLGLKRLQIHDGSQLRHVINDHNKVRMEFLRLQSITLENLPHLLSFCYVNERGSTSIPHPHPRHLLLFHEQFVFPRLESLKIVGCGELEHLFSPSVARSMVQLKSLEIRECKCLRDVMFIDEIVDDEEKCNAICFPQLNSLVIKELPNLKAFCSINYNIEFPLLQTLEIYECPELEEFIKSAEREKSQFVMRALFNDKVAVPCLEKLELWGLKSVKMIFDNQLVAGSFCKLQEMNAVLCEELLTIFSSNVIGVFQSLEVLKLDQCGSVEVIFEVKEALHVVHSMQLRRLRIFDLEKLKHVWDRDPQRLFTFQNLTDIHIGGCMSMKNIFPVSIAKDLPQLKSLCVSNCGVEEIVSSELGMIEVELLPIRFKFPQLSSLALTGLDELKCFYPGPHTIAWPMLKHCATGGISTLLKIVGVKHPCNGIQQVNGNGQSQEQSLFLVEEVIPFPQLEELALNNIDDIAMTQFLDGKVLERSDSFGKIDLASFSNSFFQRLHNLETLEISSCHFKDIDAVGSISQIRKLKLSYCNDLEHISKLGHILPNLEFFEVRWCGDLINFGSSFSPSFRSLTTLKVDYCKNMINLVTPSIVQSLVQLTTLIIVDCTTMREIVANEDTYNGVICFSKLKYLELRGLNNLTSFCPVENYYFKFSSLEELIVRDCPCLKIFVHGILSAPQLQRVKEGKEDGEGRWAGDLNITIRQLYAETVIGDDLQLSNANPDLMEIWNSNPPEILDLKNLRRIEVCNCSSLKFIFTPSMVSSLRQLHALEVKECNAMEAVIMGQEATSDNLIFPRLLSVTIESCPNLISFYLGSPPLEFPWLTNIWISDCPKMATFAFSPSHGDLNTEPFFSHKVFCPELGTLYLSSINIQKIWHDQPLHSLYFEKLASLRVNGCHNLEYMFPSFMIKHFVQLKVLLIWDCKMMEQVISMQGFTREEERMLFPKLEVLFLGDLSNLSRFCSGNYFEFPCLTHLGLSNCPLLETFISELVNLGDELRIDQNAQGCNFFNKKVVFPNLKELTREGTRDCRNIWQDQLRTNSFSKLN